MAVSLAIPRHPSTHTTYAKKEPSPRRGGKTFSEEDQFTVSVDVAVLDLKVALMFTVPRPALVARPVLLTTAIAGSEDFHSAIAEMSCADPSLKLPVAVNCWEDPRVIEAEAGAIDTLTMDAFVTVRIAVSESPRKLAVIVTVPAATAVASPEPEITAC